IELGRIIVLAVGVQGHVGFQERRVRDAKREDRILRHSAETFGLAKPHARREIYAQLFARIVKEPTVDLLKRLIWAGQISHAVEAADAKCGLGQRLVVDIGTPGPLLGSETLVVIEDL